MALFTIKRKVQVIACTLLVFGIFGLSGCNQPEETQSVGDDWVQEPPTAGPVDTTSPTPNPTPTPAPTNTPKPPNPNDTQLYSGPAELNKYMVKFVNDALAQGVDVLADTQNPRLEIQIASLTAYGSSTIGLCESGRNLRRITLSTTYWATASETTRELLMHHELGHCVLNRPHREDLLASGAVASIMYPVIMSKSTYTSNYDYYQTELFTKISSLQDSMDRNTDNIHICL